MTGLSHANGDYVFLIDSDLEEAPEELARFWTELTNREPGADVVFGVQARRRGSPFERASGWLFYSVINSFCDVKIPANFLTIRLMTRRYVDQLVNYDEREFVFAALTELVGFVKIPLVVSKAQTSPSTYDFGRKFSLVINTITSTSAKPLWFIFYFGLIITLTSFLSISYFVFRRLIWGVATDGWTSLIVSIWFFGGIFTLFLGIIGIYISRVYMETKKRPYVNIRDRYGWSTASGSELPSAVSQRHQQEERGTMAGVAHLKSKTAIMTSVKENAKL
jgi:putative glycosyltransferase